MYPSYYKLNPFTTLMLLSLAALAASAPTVLAKEYFNPMALSAVDEDNLAALNDLSAFATAGGQLPGDYTVQVSLNNRALGSLTVPFVLNAKQQLVPVLTKQQLTDWGVNTPAIAGLSELAADSPITDLSHYIEFATTQFLFSQQQLKLTVPNVALKQTARGQLDPALFDQGMTAATLNYDISGDRHWQRGGATQDSQFLNLRTGLNVGAWRLRNYSTYSHSDEHSTWASLNTTLARDVQPLKSQLTLGQTTTNGDIFNSVSFKGVKLASDDSMLPYSQRGFAPVVRGFAQSNAKVTVRQNGAIIYQTYVAPGPFAINDLYPTAYSGDLNVTVEENNGSQQSFVVPFASLAIMQRPGGVKYAAVIGQYRPNYSGGRRANFMQGTLMYGLPGNATVYGGSLLAADYQAYALGLGLDLGRVGALSFDVKQAYTQLSKQSDPLSGQAYRLQYSKVLEETHSTLNLDVSRYTSANFYEFSEANEYQGQTSRLNRRTRYQLSLNQSLAGYGSLYLMAYQQDYWQRSGKERNVTAGYNVLLGGVSYGLSYGYTESLHGGGSAHQASLQVNIPFGEWLGGHHYLTASAGYAGQGNNYLQTGLSGSALDNRLNYSVQQNYQQQDHQLGGNASLSYQGGIGRANLGYGYSHDSERLNYGLQGGIVAHPYGVTLSQTLSDTLAVVAAPGAAGVQLRNSPGVTTDARGYAIKPYLSTYSENTVTLDIDNLADDADIVNNTVTVVPTQGAVVLAKIDTAVGHRALLSLTQHGKPLPFGSSVTVKDSASHGIVGDNGEVYLSGLPPQGTLTAKWGASATTRCEVNYQLPATTLTQTIKRLNLSCSSQEEE